MPIPAPEDSLWQPDYITLDELKHYLKIPTDRSEDDLELEVAITAASRAIDDFCNRQFGRVASAELRYYTAYPDYKRGMWVVDIDDLMDDTDFSMSIGGDDITDFTLEPSNAASNNHPWTRVAVQRESEVQPTGDDGEIASTGFWGWSTYPRQVVQSSLLQASRFFNRRTSPYGIAGSPDSGTELRLYARVDPDVAVSLRGLQRPRAVA